MDSESAFQRSLRYKTINAEAAETVRAEIAEKDRETLHAISARIVEGF